MTKHCPLCGYIAFGSTSAANYHLDYDELREHLINSHSVRDIVQQLVADIVVKEQLKQKEEEYIWQCPVCEDKFVMLSDMRQHLKEYHTIDESRHLDLVRKYNNGRPYEK